jgi:hypothetical protein
VAKQKNTPRSRLVLHGPPDSARALREPVITDYPFVFSEAPDWPISGVGGNQLLFGPDGPLWTPREIEKFKREEQRRTEAAAAVGRTFRQGRRPGRVLWHDLVRELHNSGLSFPRIWRRARALAAQKHHILVAVVESSGDSACNAADDTTTHPRGPHWHCRDRRGRIVPVAAGTIKNFLARLHRTLK